MADPIQWPGESGRLYTYWQLDIRGEIKAAGGNYMFTKYTASGWLPLYIGQADDLKARLPNHERLAEAVRAGATHVLAHTTPAGETARLTEERDLIRRWHPSLNTHHRKTI